jgi:hypothetical protein
VADKDREDVIIPILVMEGIVISSVSWTGWTEVDCEPFDVLEGLLGFFTPGFSLPGPVDSLLHHGLLLFLNLLS